MKPPPSSASTETLHVTLGTAGHIDHGKTCLVKLLTGCNTDRLPEEKARGMTIDLGFAPCVLPGNRRVGIVDVPGHERFIRNMVAGAAGIDAVLLVVAADDGVMPQTIEHYHIVRLLGVSRGLIAITKIDLADAARVEAVRVQIRDLVAGGFLDDAPIVPVSAHTGEGFEPFYETLCEVVARTAERRATGPFRLHVERVFTIKGMGTVVSGIPSSGTVNKGESLTLLPRGLPTRVRGLQVYGRDATSALAGACVALNVTDLSVDEARRGTVLATPGVFAPVRFVDARFFHLPSCARPLKSRNAVRFHAGTSEVGAHLLLPTLDPLPPGADAYVQIELEESLVVAPGDRFIVRSPAPPLTLGGGYVVSPDDMRIRRTRGDWDERCLEREVAFRDPTAAVEFVVRSAGRTPLPLAEAAARALLTPTDARARLDELVRDGRAIELPSAHFAHVSIVEEIEAEFLTKLSDLHTLAPLSLGFGRKDLLSGWDIHKALADAAIERLLASGRLGRSDAGLFLPDRRPQLSPAQQALAGRIGLLYERTAYLSPRRDELGALLHATDADLRGVLSHLLQAGVLVELSAKVIVHRRHLDVSRSVIEDYFAGHAELDTTDFKNMLGTSRKYAIAILEYWDRVGLTRRIGDIRRLNAQRTSP